MGNKVLIEANWRKLFNFMMFNIGLCAVFQPTPCVSTCLLQRSHYACNRIYGSRESRMCNKGLIEAFEGKLFNFKKSKTNENPRLKIRDWKNLRLKNPRPTIIWLHFYFYRLS